MANTGRREYDREIDPVVQNVIEQTVADTRHILRNEFTAALVDMANKMTALANTIAEGNLQSVQDQSEVKAKLDNVCKIIEGPPAMLDRIVKLEGNDITGAAVASAINQQREDFRNALKWATTTIIATLLLIAAVLGVVLG